VTGNWFDNGKLPGEGGFDIYRQTIGFERTICNGCASVGVRIPILEHHGSSADTVDGVGDATIILKVAFCDDCYTGNVFSGGLAITVPTGRDMVLADDTNIHSVLLQPWLGFICNTDAWSCDPRCYLIGFSSVVVPTVRKDATFLSTDLGIGYRLYGCREYTSISAIIPTLEAHLSTPLNHQGINGNTGVVEFPDQLIMTAGVHIGLGCNQAWFTLAGATPVTGPRPFEVEVIAQLNLNF
jgi:hypothetical protein